MLVSTVWNDSGVRAAHFSHSIRSCSIFFDDAPLFWRRCGVQLVNLSWHRLLVSKSDGEVDRGRRLALPKYMANNLRLP